MGTVAEKMQLNIDKSSWKLVKFGDVVFEPKAVAKNLQAEGIQHVVGLEHIDTEDIHLKRFASIEESTTFTKKFAKGDVLFGRRRAYLKKAAQAPFGGICSGDITVFRAKNDLLPALLPFVVNNDKFFDYAIKHSAGGLSPRVKFKDLANYSFHLPPKDQQAQLAELLWAMDEVVERERKIREKYIVSRISFVQKFFIENNFPIAKLQEVAEIRYGITLNSKRQEMESKAPYLRVANVGRGEISLNDVKEIGCSESEINAYQLRNQDVLFVEGHADINEIGRAAIWAHENNQMLHQNHLIRVRCDSSLSPVILEAYANCAIGQLYFRGNSKSTSGLNTINSTVVKEFPIPLVPTDLTKDFEYRKMLLDHVFKDLENRIHSSKVLQKSLINQIF